MARKRTAGWDEPRGDRPNQHVGGLLHRMREAAGVSQRQVAEAIGIHPSFISHIERGRRPVPDRVLRYYADRFDEHDLLGALVEISREADLRRRKLRDPELIARQNAYPIPGDAATFLAEDPPDGISVPLGATLTKRWTIRNSGTVSWRGRRLRRIGPITGPFTISSPRFAAVPDANPGDAVTISIDVLMPTVQAATFAQWKMVDQDDLLFFPTKYSVGLGIYVHIGHAGGLQR